MIIITITIVLCLICSLCFLYIHKYLYFIIYFLFTLLITMMNYFSYYKLESNYLLIKLGLIPIKIKYQSIWQVKEVNKKVLIVMSKFSLGLYPLDKDKFISNLNKKIDKNI